MELAGGTEADALADGVRIALGRGGCRASGTSSSSSSSSSEDSISMAFRLPAVTSCLGDSESDDCRDTSGLLSDIDDGVGSSCGGGSFIVDEYLLSSVCHS